MPHCHSLLGMAIAVSVIVKPSKSLFAMVAAMSVVTMAIGAGIGFGYVGELSLILRLVVSVFIVFLAAFGFCHGIRHQKPIHIDISGAGQLRLTKSEKVGACVDQNWPHVEDSAEMVKLSPDTTIWPYMLLLRLQTDSGRKSTVRIFPDGVSRDNFRALSVACRWIAAHNNSLECKDF